MKAIETQYKGYRFRSRLEARWAVFFDALGIRYEYEPEGYILNDGSCYLPDFLLRNQLIISTRPSGDRFVVEERVVDMWIEVKPETGLIEEDLHKCFSFSHGLGHDALAFVAAGLRLDLISTHDRGVCSPFVVSDRERCGKRSWIMSHGAESYNLNWFHMLHDWAWFMKEVPDQHAEVLAALNKAKSARFEHGETP